MTYTIYHKSVFEYPSAVTFSHNLARLKPRNTAFQKVHEYQMEIEPSTYEKSEFTDIFGNTNTHLLLRKGHRSLEVIGRSKVEILSEALKEYHNELQTNSLSYKEALDRLAQNIKEDLAAKLFLFSSELIPKASEEIKQYALESFLPEHDLYASVIAFMGRMYEDFEFKVGVSNVGTSVENVFKTRSGVCQDFAHFAIAALRSIGLPARYVSGYIETLPAEGEEKLFGVDASHAWVSVYIPGAGWLDFDPTNNLIPHSQHILLGYGRDYYDIAPLKGVVMSSGEHQLSISVDVRRSE